MFVTTVQIVLTPIKKIWMGMVLVMCATRMMIMILYVIQVHLTHRAVEQIIVLIKLILGRKILIMTW